MRPNALTALTLVALLFASIVSAQAVRYTVEVLDANDQVAPVEAFRSGDILSLRIGIHNALDRELEPSSVWIVLPPVEGIRTQIATALLGYTNPERYRDASGREATGFEANLTAYYPVLAASLPPGANHHVRIRLTVVSSANDLAGLVDALHLINRFDRTIGTRVNELPTAPTRPAAPASARADAVAEHVAAMFGHLGAVRYTCPEIPGANPADTICGEVEGSFRHVQQMWDLYYDWANRTPVTARALDAWARDENNLYTREFDVDGDTIVVAYASTGANAGILMVLIDR